MAVEIGKVLVKRPIFWEGSREELAKLARAVFS